MLEQSFGHPILRFSVLGIPVRVELTFLVTVFLLADSRRGTIADFGIWLGVVFVSVLVHELGHALVGRRFGLQPDIRLYGWGGLTGWTSGGPLTPGRRLAVSLSGPATGIALGVACAGAGRALPDDALLLQRVADDFVWAGGVWGCVNLLPILPLDGGRALQAILARFAPSREEPAARIVSAATGLAVGALALQRGWLMPGLLAVWLGVDSARRLLEARRQEQDRALCERVEPKLKALVEEGDSAGLVSTATAALAEARSDATRAWLVEHVVFGHVLAGSVQDAVAALKEAPRTGGVGSAMEGSVVALAVGQRKRAIAAEAGASDPGDEADAPWAHACALLSGPRDAPIDAVDLARAREAGRVLGRDADAAALGEDLLRRAPDPDLAFAVAVAWAHAGDAGRATSFAQEAVSLGFRDWERAADALSMPAGERARRAMEQERAASA